jgi:hypothetical protein
MDQALFKRMQEAALRFRSGESDREEIMTPNGLALLVRDASDPRGFRIDFVDDGARHSVSLQQYPAMPTRPPGYPAPLPFLEDCASTVDTLDQSVTWRDPSEPERAFERLCREIADDGWMALGPVSDARDPDGASRSFEKEGVVRTLQLETDGVPRLVLRERRGPPSRA